MDLKRRVVLLLVAAVLAGAGALAAHDMFLKLPSYFLEPNAAVAIALVNGTFERSENVITRDRMRDVSIVRPGGAVTRPPASAWRDSAVHRPDADSVDTSILEFRTSGPGTYVIGVSTKPRTITLSAEDFDAYLAHDGVLDVLEERTEQREEGREAPASVTERYSKHVKAIAQAGEPRTDTFGFELDYPVEFVPLTNPYDLSVGDTLGLHFRYEGRPVANQLVFASYDGYHEHGEAGGERGGPAETPGGAAEAPAQHREAVQARTNSEGVARIPLIRPGRWYVRTIHMRETADEADVDYESNWATVTFEIR